MECYNQEFITLTLFHHELVVSSDQTESIHVFFSTIGTRVYELNVFVHPVQI